MNPAPGLPREVGCRGAFDERRRLAHSPGEFLERRTQQQLWLERIVMRSVENEHRMHFTRSDAVGEPRGKKGA